MKTYACIYRGYSLLKEINSSTNNYLRKTEKEAINQYLKGTDGDELIDVYEITIKKIKKIKIERKMTEIKIK